MPRETDDENNFKTDRSRGAKGGLLGTLLATALVATCLSPLCSSVVRAQQPNAAKPNILVIFGDDIGQTNISAYSDGLVGYRTPNIDRIAKEGLRFTDYYAENSCTAGRSTFITGQVCLRTGLCKVGIPGATVGMAMALPVSLAPGFGGRAGRPGWRFPRRGGNPGCRGKP